MPPRSELIVAGLVLAAGSSRRLGRPKQTLPFADGTLLDWAVAQAEGASLDPLVVVLPADLHVPEPRVTRARSVRVATVGSCSSSLHAGLEALSGRCDALAILPSDQPALTSGLIDIAVAGWRAAATPLALTLSFRGRPGHPLIFSSALFPTLAALHGEKAMWRVLEDLGDAVTRVAVDAPLPCDVDTWDDYLALTDATA
jgi:molybdenum cofactor cytidylyltransferase